MKLDGDLYWTGIQHPRRSTLRLTGVSLRNLQDEIGSWPDTGGLSLNGLTYVDLTNMKLARTREPSSPTIAPWRPITRTTHFPTVFFIGLMDN
jgi:hypothetical protein